MTARLVILTCFMSICSLICRAQEVVRVEWMTKHAAPPVVFAAPVSNFLPLFRGALAIFPESNLVAMVMSQPSLLGIPPKDAAELQPLFANRYKKIYSDPVFRNVPSALPYCFAEKTPSYGLALVYVPKDLNTNTPCLVFLHGYGGSFLWSQQLLAESFPDHIIICPAYGISSGLMPPAYLAECIANVEQKLGRKIIKPTLIGLSAGGFGATQIFVKTSNHFERLIVLAAYPPPDTIPQFNEKMTANFVVGERESYVQSGYFGNSMRKLQARKAKVEYRIIPSADHFFMLAQEQETMKILHAWLGTSPTDQR